MFNHHRIPYKCSMTHLLLPSTVTRKLLIIQASYCRITKLRARLTPKCKKLDIRKCGIVPGFCRSGHTHTHTHTHIYIYSRTYAQLEASFPINY